VQGVSTRKVKANSAATIVAELGLCLQDVEVNGRYVGEFSMRLILFGKDHAALKRQVAPCSKVFALHDAQLIEEAITSSMRGWPFCRATRTLIYAGYGS